MTPHNQPTYDELAVALGNLAQVLGIVGAEADAREALRALRVLKTTWVGEAENKLRFAIINALED